MSKYKFGIRETDGTITQSHSGSKPNYGSSHSKIQSLTKVSHLDVLPDETVGSYNTEGTFEEGMPLVYKINVGKSSAWEILAVRNRSIREGLYGSWIGPLTFGKRQLLASEERQEGSVYIFEPNGRTRPVPISELRELERRAILKGRDAQHIPVKPDFSLSGHEDYI